MADYLTTNWTEKMKNNPVANKILNPKRIHYRDTHIFTFHPTNDVKRFNGRISGIDVKYDGTLGFTARDMIKEHPEMTYANRLKHLQDTDPYFGSNPRRRNIDEVDFADTGSDASDFDAYSDDSADEFGQKLIAAEDDTEEKVAYEKDYWAHTYVKDYINIHHPKLRANPVQALTNKPLQIKPPSIFFSDV